MRVFFRLVLLLVLLVAAGCSRKKASAVVRQASVPVRVAPAVTRAVPIEIQAIGRTEASSTVNVKSRVTGPLRTVSFHEGNEVSTGQKLFEIDRRPFEVALRQADAALARARTEAENARAEARRYAFLLAQGVASKETAEQRRTQADALEAAVQQALAEVAARRLDLTYCTVRAPIAGRTGALLVKEGNTVKADDTTVLVINALEPMFVSFSVPERELPTIRRFAADAPLRARAEGPAGAESPSDGTVTFIDNAIDAATGTIRLRATFDNRDRRLWPGEFVRISVVLTTKPDAVLVPSSAVQLGQTGSYVFVVDDQNHAATRAVKTASTIGDETVVEGVRAGERVVVEGQLRLTPGAAVTVLAPHEQDGGAP